MSEWIKVLNKSDVPSNGGTIATVGDKQIAVFAISDTYYAIDNTCPHRGGPLGEGELEGSIVTCPWHGWQFDITTGKSPINPAACVQQFQTKVEGDDLLIKINSV